MSESERDADRPSADDSSDDASTAADASEEWESQADLDPAESPFPQCPRCGRPVTRVTSTSPTDHTASPCGCRVSPNLLE